MSRERGFTLIEVAVAMAILGVALTLAISLFGGALRTASRVSSYSDAVAMAREKMDSVLCCPDAEFYDFEEGSEGALLWTRTIKPFSDESGEVEGLVSVSVTVTWPEAGVNREVRLESLLYRGTKGASA